MRPFHNHGVVPTAALTLLMVLCAGVPARASSYVVFRDDRTGFETYLAATTGPTVVDSGGAFAPDPVLGSVPSLTRSGSVGGVPVSYTAYDLQFSNTPTGTIVPGVVGDDVGALSDVGVESPAAQSGGVGSGTWGFDSGAISTTRRSGLLADFATPGGLGRFGVDLIDFEAALGNEGELRLYAAGQLVFATSFDLPPDGGDASTHFLGVVANPSAGGVPFDQAVVLVGGPGDRWAADSVTFALARTPEPGTWALFGLGLLGFGFARRRRQNSASARCSAVSSRASSASRPTDAETSTSPSTEACAGISASAR